MFLSQPMLETLQQEIKSVAGSSDPVKAIKPVAGGDINRAFMIETERHAFFVKVNSLPDAIRIFVAESAGLGLLRQALPEAVPTVLSTGQAHGDAFLLMEWIEPGARDGQASARLGALLATLHRKHQKSFGLDHDNFIGTLPQSNSEHGDWATFFIRERLDKQVRAGLANGWISTALATAFEKLYDRLGDLFPDEPPSLLHGDLWGGNWLARTHGAPVLIDPAVYYGHREADMAMTRLFGGFDDQFYHAYHESYPLSPGWQDRVDLFNLYPLLVHLNLFGRAYLPKIEAIVGRYV